MAMHIHLVLPSTKILFPDIKLQPDKWCSHKMFPQ